MFKIRTFINKKFKDFPITEEVEMIKEEMIESLIIKYNELIKEGKSEDDAFLYITNNFGDIEELKKEYGNIDKADALGENKMKLISILMIIGSALLAVLTLLSIILVLTNFDISILVETDYEVLNLLFKRILIGIIIFSPLSFFIGSIILYQRVVILKQEEWFYIVLFMGILIMILLNLFAGVCFILAGALGLYYSKKHTSLRSLKNKSNLYLLLLFICIVLNNNFLKNNYFRINYLSVLNTLIVSIVSIQIIIFLGIIMYLIFYKINKNFLDKKAEKYIIFLVIITLLIQIFFNFSFHYSYLVLMLPLTLIFLFIFIKNFKNKNQIDI